MSTLISSIGLLINTACMTVPKSAYSRNHQEVVFIKKNIKNNLSLWGFEPAPIFVTKYKNHYTVEANFNLA